MNNSRVALGPARAKPRGLPAQALIMDPARAKNLTVHPASGLKASASLPEIPGPWRAVETGLISDSTPIPHMRSSKIIRDAQAFEHAMELERAQQALVPIQCASSTAGSSSLSSLLPHDVRRRSPLLDLELRLAELSAVSLNEPNSPRMGDARSRVVAEACIEVMDRLQALLPRAYVPVVGRLATALEPCLFDAQRTDENERRVTHEQALRQLTFMLDNAASEPEGAQVRPAEYDAVKSRALAAEQQLEEVATERRRIATEQRKTQAALYQAQNTVKQLSRRIDELQEDATLAIEARLGTLTEEKQLLLDELTHVREREAALLGQLRESVPRSELDQSRADMYGSRMRTALLQAKSRRLAAELELEIQGRLELEHELEHVRDTYTPRPTFDDNAGGFVPTPQPTAHSEEQLGERISEAGAQRAEREAPMGTSQLDEEGRQASKDERSKRPSGEMRDEARPRRRTSPSPLPGGASGRCSSRGTTPSSTPSKRRASRDVPDALKLEPCPDEAEAEGQWPAASQAAASQVPIPRLELPPKSRTASFILPADRSHTDQALAPTASLSQRRKSKYNCDIASSFNADDAGALGPRADSPKQRRKSKFLAEDAELADALAAAGDRAGPPAEPEAVEHLPKPTPAEAPTIELDPHVEQSNTPDQSAETAAEPEDLGESDAHAPPRAWWLDAKEQRRRLSRDDTLFKAASEKRRRDSTAAKSFMLTTQLREARGQIAEMTEMVPCDAPFFFVRPAASSMEEYATSNGSVELAIKLLGLQLDRAIFVRNRKLPLNDALRTAGAFWVFYTRAASLAQENALAEVENAKCEVARLCARPRTTVPSLFQPDLECRRSGHTRSHIATCGCSVQACGR